MTEGVDGELGEEALCTVVGAEQGVQIAGVETRHEQHPSLHLGPLPCRTGDQEQTTVIKEDVGVYLDWSLKQLPREIGNTLGLVSPVCDLTACTRGCDTAGEVVAGNNPSKSP